MTPPQPPTPQPRVYESVSLFLRQKCAYSLILRENFFYEIFFSSQKTSLSIIYIWENIHRIYLYQYFLSITNINLKLPHTFRNSSCIQVSNIVTCYCSTTNLLSNNTIGVRLIVPKFLRIINMITIIIANECWYPIFLFFNFKKTFHHHVSCYIFIKTYLSALIVRDLTLYFHCKDFNRYVIAFHGCLDILQNLATFDILRKTKRNQLLYSFAKKKNTMNCGISTFMAIKIEDLVRRDCTSYITHGDKHPTGVSSMSSALLHVARYIATLILLHLLLLITFLATFDKEINRCVFNVKCFVARSSLHCYVATLLQLNWQL